MPVQRAIELSIGSASLTQWLVQGLCSDHAVGHPRRRNPSAVKASRAETNYIEPHWYRGYDLPAVFQTFGTLWCCSHQSPACNLGRETDRPPARSDFAKFGPMQCPTRLCIHYAGFWAPRPWILGAAIVLEVRSSFLSPVMFRSRLRVRRFAMQGGPSTEYDGMARQIPLYRLVVVEYLDRNGVSDLFFGTAKHGYNNLQRFSRWV